MLFIAFRTKIPRTCDEVGKKYALPVRWLAHCHPQPRLSGHVRSATGAEKVGGEHHLNYSSSVQDDVCMTLGRQFYEIGDGLGHF